MQHVFILSMDLPDLALAEAIAVTKGSVAERRGELAVIDCKRKNWALGLTKEVHELLFICSPEKLEQEIRRFDWMKLYRPPHKIILHHTNKSPKEVAGKVWKQLLGGAVDMSHPATEFHFFFSNDEVYATKLAWRNEEDFTSRRPDKLPALHPTMMHPKMARALVNLTGVPARGKIFDPFCGAGGFLIEAGLMGLKPLGFDIEEEMLERCRKNLKHMRIEAQVKKQDATTLTKKMKYVVADLPYGRNTRKQDLEKLYLSFLKRLDSLLGKRAVVVFPHFVDWKKLVQQTNLHLVAEFKQYVHGGLSRHIVVLEK